jgi:hypothetical protein
MENITKSQIEDYLLNMLNQVEEGNLNPLDLKIEIKTLTDLLGGIDKQVAPLIATEGQKWHKQTYKGYKIEYVDSGGRYSYDHLQEWVNAKQSLKIIELNAQLSLKALEKNQLMIDEGGVITEPAVWKCNDPFIKLTKTKEGA